MEKIRTLRLRVLRNAAHGKYMTIFLDLVMKFPAVRNTVATFAGEFAGLLDRENNLINVMSKSDCTEQIACAAGRMNRALTGMRGAIVAALHHFEPAVAKAAKSLLNRYTAFGNITRKSYEERAFAVDLLLADLRDSEYAAKVAAVGLTPWLGELRDAREAFLELLERRVVETSEKPQGRLRTVMRELETVYHRMTALITAAAMLDNSGAYDGFIAQLNAEIDYFNIHSHHHAVKNLGVSGVCVIESIPVQTCTGKPVTPLPKVYYREKDKPAVELVFSRDFHVSYRNNVKTGTAHLILHGNGAYRGRTETSFNIVDQ
jgi:hypothetical protein